MRCPKCGNEVVASDFVCIYCQGVLREETIEQVKIFKRVDEKWTNPIGIGKRLLLVLRNPSRAFWDITHHRKRTTILANPALDNSFRHRNPPRKSSRSLQTLPSRMGLPRSPRNTEPEKIFSCNNTSTFSTASKCALAFSNAFRVRLRFAGCTFLNSFSKRLTQVY